MCALQRIVDELNRKIMNAVLEAEGKRGRYVPRPRPDGFHDEWSDWQKKEWYKMEEKIRLESEGWPLEEKPADWDEWSLLRKRTWLKKQELARESMVGHGLTAANPCGEPVLQL